MNKKFKINYPDWPPSKEFFKRLVLFSAIGWLIVLGIYWLFIMQHKLETPSAIETAFGTTTAPQVSGTKKGTVTELNDFDAKTHIQSGNQLLKAGDAQNALKHFSRASVIVPQNAEILKKTGDAFFLLGKFEKAEKLYRKAMEDENNSSALLSKLGLTLFFQNRTDEGISLIKKSISKDTTCGECYNALGKVLSSTSSKREEATEAFLRSMALAPDNPDMYYYYAKYLMDQDQYYEASLVLKHIISNFPLYGKAHARLGMAYYYLNKQRLCEREYQIALTLNPNDFNTWYNLGELYYQFKNDSASALRCFSNAIKLNPSHSEAHFKMGLILFRNQQYKEAKTHFETALTNDNNNIKIMFQLAVSYEKLNRFDMAVHLYKNIMEVDPTNKIAKHKIELINSGRISS